MEDMNYEKNLRTFLIARDKFRILKRTNKLTKEQIKKIEKKFRVMSYWLLLNTPENKEEYVLKHRAYLCLKNWKLHC